MTTLYHILFIILGAVTAWVAIITGMLYLTRARPRGVTRRCCLEAPCSDHCASQLKSLRAARDLEYDKVVAEIGNIITAGQAAAPAFEEDTA